MTGRVDLHIHSNCSDGSFSPVELAGMAKEAGLAAAALTDHDNMDGVKAFIAECGRLGLEGIGGIEISTSYPRQLHIVGLYVCGDEIDKTIKRLKNARKERNVRMLEKLRENGFDVTEADLIGAAEGVSIESCGRPHMAAALVKKGYARDIGDAFERLLKRGRPCYVEKFSLSPEESVKLIKRCGGIAVWAHPVSAVQTEEEMLELALKLKVVGLDAMECYYSRYSEADSAMCKRTAGQAGLLRSGGSDFHGTVKPDVRLGVVSEGFVPYEILEKLKRVINIQQ